MGNLTYNSDYDVRLATLGEMGGDITKKYDSVYSIDLEILKIIQEGGIGGASIDDEHVSTTTTYSSSKIMTLLADAGFNVEVVQELPATGDAHTIYFVPKTGSTGDIYDEYLYVDNAWELIGSTEVDLSNYYNKTEVDGLLSGKQNVLTAGDNINIDSNGVISANIEVATVEEVEDLFAPKAVKFKANAASTVGLEKLSSNQTLEYSVDEGATWNNMDTSTSVSLAQGDKMYVRGQLSGNNSGINYTKFTMTGSIAASGNINAIWNKNNPESTTLSYNYCGFNMFQGCSSLTSSPELPATTLTDGCYYGMFSGCTSLTTAPELPATTLVSKCYVSMFSDCKNLTSAPELPATTLSSDCYVSMFRGCTNLTSAPELPATTLTHSCYQFMFGGCTSLTTAPELPAIKLASYCYAYLFSGCTSLNYIKCLATDKSASNCTQDWVSGVASTGTFVKNSAMSGWTTGNNGIPSNWTVQDA